MGGCINTCQKEEEITEYRLNRPAYGSNKGSIKNMPESIMSSDNGADETDDTSAPEITPEPEDFKAKLEAMLTKGRPQQEAKIQKKAESWGPISREDLERRQSDMSDQRADDFMALPKLKKARTLTKKHDVDNYDF